VTLVVIYLGIYSGMISANSVATPLMSMNFEQILRELFHDPEKPLALLRKHKLELLFINSIELISEEIKQTTIDFGKVRDIASTVLVTVNSRLREIEDENERGRLEQIAKEIAEYLLMNLLNSSKSSNKILLEITAALQTTSKLNGYNFEALVAILKLSRKSAIFKLPLRSGYSYKWNGPETDLDDLLRNMKDAGWIGSSKSFKTLFTDHKAEVLNIPYAKEKLCDLLALFDVLKNRKLISPKGGKGHFHPLTVHLVDLDNNFLLDRSPKTIKSIAKRNKENWARMIKNAEIWVAAYKVKERSRLPWPR
jgi:hypothetical protein